MASKIVQITDLHLYSDRGGSDTQLDSDPSHPIHHASLAAVLDDIERNVPDLTALVVSGDIAATTGKTPLDELAYKNLRAELEARGSELLSKTLTVPGNHDNRKVMLQQFPESCEADGAAGTEEEPGLFFASSVFAADGTEWRLVGLDSGAISGSGLQPQLEAQQLLRLREELADAQHAGNETTQTRLRLSLCLASVCFRSVISMDHRR